MPFPYPTQITTNWDKTRYIMRLKEYSRLLHNFAGYWFKHGLTQDQYDNGMDAADFDPRTDRLQGPGVTWFILTDQIKARYSYQPTITAQQRLNFITNDWQPRQDLIEDEIMSHIRNLALNNSNDNLFDLDIL